MTNLNVILRNFHRIVARLMLCFEWVYLLTYCGVFLQTTDQAYRLFLEGWRTLWVHLVLCIALLTFLYGLYLRFSTLYKGCMKLTASQEQRISYYWIYQFWFVFLGLLETSYLNNANVLRFLTSVCIPEEGYLWFMDLYFLMWILFTFTFDVWYGVTSRLLY